jgi:hypothetical protein
MTTNRSPLLGLTFLVTVGLALAACSSAAGPGTTSPSGSPPAASPSPSAVPPSAPGGSDAGALPPDSPIVGEPPVRGGGDPGNQGQPTLVVPKPPTINPQPVAISQLVSQVEGRRVLLNARWWSGVEPCYVLDSVKVDRTGNTFTITLLEGASQQGAICIELAMEKVTLIDLGELEPGSYMIQASKGDAAPITVGVS